MLFFVRPSCLKMWMDLGIKNPERFFIHSVGTPHIGSRVQALERLASLCGASLASYHR
jgi:hypothetical protein